MTGYERGVIWFNRFVVAAATFVMTMIGLRNLRDPRGATLPLDIALRSPMAVTICSNAKASTTGRPNPSRSEVSSTTSHRL